MKLNKDTQLFFSVSHNPGSFGMIIYNHVFQEMSLNSVYISRYLKDANGFGKVMRDLNVKGASVSMPLKTTILSELDELSPEASKTDSVNTILNQNGRLIGYNTDYFGFVKLLENLPKSPKKILIYGTGSVVSSIVLSIIESTDAEVILSGRNSQKVAARAKELNIEYTSDFSTISKVDLFINATPAHLLEIENIDSFQLSGVHIFDIKVTQDFSTVESFVKSKKGIFIPGLQMFLFQFQKQFEIYTQKTLDNETLRGLSKKLFNYDLS